MQSILKEGDSRTGMGSGFGRFQSLTSFVLFTWSALRAFISLSLCIFTLKSGSESNLGSHYHKTAEILGKEKLYIYLYTLNENGLIFEKWNNIDFAKNIYCVEKLGVLS